ncbi:MAG: hypothetical protein HC881_18660 [Leptolyngbyaceae cyanobacterium SL_7_1]|nr:hypothetical protein [Leptolyngbyaceae cyanobacterium SL_7_1]
MRIKFLVILLSVGLLFGCENRAADQSQEQSQSTAQPGSPAAQPTGATAPQAPTPIPPSQLPQDGFSCVTPNYFGLITWEQDQPQMSFGRGEVASLRGAPVTVVGNADGSKTYGASGESTYYIRVFPDQTCLLQTLSGQQEIAVEEYGQVSAIGQPINNSSANNAQGSTQDSLAMTCPGNIQSTIDFTAYHSREAGFERIDLKPRTSDTVLTSSLSYDGTNTKGQGIWRGNVNQMADVTLVHLSTAQPKKGDEISVGYDNRWGQAICQ